MGLFSSGRGPRGFRYNPRYYDPEEDDNQALRRRMQSNRLGDRRQSPFSLIVLFGLLLLTLLIYQAL